MSHPLVAAETLPPSQPLRVGGVPPRTPVPAQPYHALDASGEITICGLDATEMSPYGDMQFENSAPGGRCSECQAALGT